MSKQVPTDSAEQAMESNGMLKNYSAPWKGQLILVCRKCQKKLGHEGKKSGLSKLNKKLIKRAQREGDGPKLYVVGVSCLKMCPKGGVTVCTQQQLAAQQCSIVRTAADIDTLIERCKQNAIP